MNALTPADMSAMERLDELGEILVLGLIRMRARMSSPKSADCGEISLDIIAQQSGPDAKYCWRE